MLTKSDYLCIFPLSIDPRNDAIDCLKFANGFGNTKQGRGIIINVEILEGKEERGKRRGEDEG